MHATDAHLVEAIAHLPRRTRGESDGEDALRTNEALVHHVGDAVGHGTRLTCTGTRQDAYRSAWGGRGSALVLIQQGQIRPIHRGTTP